MLTDHQTAAAAERLRSEPMATPQQAARILMDELSIDWVEAFLTVNSLIRNHNFHLYIYENECYLRHHGQPAKLAF